MTDRCMDNDVNKPIVPGIEDTFYYEISDDCVSCGACAESCPVQAIAAGADTYTIDATICIDCGTCASVCPIGAAHPVQQVRDSISFADVDPTKLYFNPGCALSVYKPGVPEQMLAILQANLGDVRLHTTCCRHDPGLEPGSTIINNCAGCDRRFCSLYDGLNTISFWEVVDALPELELPSYEGLTASVHDSCGYRHKPQVHAAVRSLLTKMDIAIEESEFSGTNSVCCGDNFYGQTPNERVEERIRMRAEQLPTKDVVVYCIGCVRAMEFAGKRVHYLPDLIFGRDTEAMPDTLDEYHGKLEDYIAVH